jgi:hypothetical protein
VIAGDSILLDFGTEMTILAHRNIGRTPGQWTRNAPDSGDESGFEWLVKHWAARRIA